MEIVKWRKSYETGIAEMDAQHRELIELINQLYLIMRDKKDDSEVAGIIKRCLAYAEHHLQEEERLLKEHDYPGLQEQIDIHAGFIEKAKELEIQAGEGSNTSTSSDTYRFLRHWWIDHIVGVDMKYGEFLKERGL